MLTETNGLTLLREWMAKTNTSQASLARILGLSQPSVCEWLAGRTRPDGKFREALRLLAGIAVVEWCTESEKESLAEIVRKAGEGAHA
jgi:transcriptional regulator with XRE-family HTH domain